MIVIYYDPDQKDVPAYTLSMADGEAEAFVNKVIDQQKLFGGQIAHAISNELVLMCFRLAIKEKRIAINEIEIFEKGKLLKLDEDGRIINVEVQSYYDKILAKLM